MKKYAEYVFKSFDLDKNKDLISFKNFTELVELNPKIYQKFYQGFHDYLWMNEKDGPKYKKMKPTVEDTCIQVYKEVSKQVYMVNIRNSLLIFESDKMNKLLEIKNL